MTTKITFSAANLAAANSRTKDERIAVIVTRILNAYFQIKKFNTRDSAIFNANIIFTTIDESRNFNKEWICENIDFFDFNYESIESIINVEKHVFYWNVYTFIDRLKNITIHRRSDKNKNVISQCLRKLALI